MIRAYKQEDLNSLLAIEEECFFHPWKKEMFESEINNGSELFVLEIDKQIVGYIDLHFVQENLELNNIAVKKDFWNKGYGQSLLDYMFDLAKSRNSEKIFLEVNSNNKARLLYEKNGFIKNRIRKNYYPDGDAIEMVKELR